MRRGRGGEKAGWFFAPPPPTLPLLGLVGRAAILEELCYGCGLVTFAGPRNCGRVLRRRVLSLAVAPPLLDW
ncbi:Hypothetical predicted protein [Marmota monax]|uniref:Uncharacterized protein n=1 Tax=Marmota monax TaxID=9995 RepID=A0A5E4BZQ6_MARMO|nr:Hypothetical predicted protein [Marmota monax]